MSTRWTTKAASMGHWSSTMTIPKLGEFDSRRRHCFKMSSLVWFPDRSMRFNNIHMES